VMQQDHFMSWTTLMGILFIIVGVSFLIIPLILRYVDDIEKIHPLLVFGYRFDGTFIGTSPILIITLIIIYLLLRYYS